MRKTKAAEFAELFGGSWKYDGWSQWRCDDGKRYVSRVHTGGYDVNGEPAPGHDLIMYDGTGKATYVWMARDALGLPPPIEATPSPGPGLGEGVARE